LAEEARVRFVITVDTEPDNVWSNFHSRSLRNVLGLHQFHSAMVALGVRPTYLITWSVASDPACVKALRNLENIGPCEIGTHLHAWEVPPFLPGGEDQAYAVFAHDLHPKHFEAKLRNITERIAENFPLPRSYRAGRFGFACEHIPILESMGYTVDSSITPLLDRGGKYGLPKASGGKGGRDYREAPLDPYHPDYADDLRPGKARLLEVPLTVAFSRATSPFMETVHRRGPRAVQWALSALRISRLIHASPPEVPWNDLRTMLMAAFTTGRRVFNFILHSSETMAGGAPWIKTEAQAREVVDRISRCASWLEERATVEFCTLSQVAENHAEAPTGDSAAVEVVI